MALHLLKLCVGVASITDLEDWISMSMTMRRRSGQAEEQIHTTRMVPKRVEELLDGGSLYWVIKGQVSCRQVLRDIRPFTDNNGIGRCQLVLVPELIPIVPRPCRAFQGWRYLADHEKPADISAGEAAIVDMPDDMRRELAQLGLI
jgi:hypothetical protein